MKMIIVLMYKYKNSFKGTYLYFDKISFIFQNKISFIYKIYIKIKKKKIIQI